MSRTLNFTQNLLAMGRNLQQCGQTQAAARLLSRLSSFRELPSDLAEETHVRLAELHLQSGRFKKARRQLAAALALQPDNAHYHYLMAGAVEEDDARAPQRALTHYRRCAILDPDNAEYLCGWGLLALSQGETAEALKALRRAVELAPDDPEILRQVVRGLRAEGETAEAKKILRTALFRNPRDQRFRALWTHHQFQLLRADQQADEQPCEPHKKRGPVLLPFARPAPDGKKQIRHDLPSGTPGPRLPQRRRLSGKK
jgi:tetratricopeptide (TPR) repeat protein